MRRRTPALIDGMEFPLTLAGPLRRAFDDVVSSPAPATTGRASASSEFRWNERSRGGRAWGKRNKKRRAVLIVEDDAELRSLTAALFEDEEIESIECESAEAAFATLLIGGRDVAMIFADVRLRGVMDGIDLAREVRMRCPLLPVILTSGHPREPGGELPPDVAYMPKPWQPLNVLIAAEHDLGRADQRIQ
jgi:CheY-like chemotaxis protein